MKSIIILLIFVSFTVAIENGTRSLDGGLQAGKILKTTKNFEIFGKYQTKNDKMHILFPPNRTIHSIMEITIIPNIQRSSPRVLFTGAAIDRFKLSVGKNIEFGSHRRYYGSIWKKFGHR